MMSEKNNDQMTKNRLYKDELVKQFASYRQKKFDVITDDALYDLLSKEESDHHDYMMKFMNMSEFIEIANRLGIKF